jgi:hypothetical protein
MNTAARPAWTPWIWVALITALLFGVSAPSAHAQSLPENVNAESHAWLQAHMPRALPYLIQTPYGLLDRKHVYVVEGLGDWGAGRAKGRHQGTDFVLDLPHRAGSERLRVGSLLEGKVVHIKHNWGAYGTTVFVYREEAPKMVYIYAHLDEPLVREGDRVRVGDPLGYFGCTGNCRGLKGAHLKHQVHVELYAMPATFKASDVKWEHGPLGQLRKLAIHTHRNHGVDLSHYFGSFKLDPVTRNELEDRYNKNKDGGGLKVYLDQQKKRRGAKKVAAKKGK